MPLEHVNHNWAWLKEHLDRIIDEVNQNKPLASTTIAVDANPNGSMIRVLKNADGQQQQAAVIWNGVGWVTVTVVDPANNCQQSQLTVLAQVPGSSVIIG